jgi:hypothetical protein
LIGFLGFRECQSQLAAAIIEQGILKVLLRQGSTGAVTSARRRTLGGLLLLLLRVFGRIVGQADIDLLLQFLEWIPHLGSVDKLIVPRDQSLSVVNGG